MRSRKPPPPPSLRVTGSVRAAVMRRCAGTCERCGLEWPWNLYLFVVDPATRARAANVQVLCGRCSAGESGPFAPLVVPPPLRERMRSANNRRSGAARLTESRRRRLIAARGGRCEICGIAGSERQLEVHHRLGILRGGDDAEQNLMVLCFACHHHLRPCATGCGRWAKKPSRLCGHCATRALLEASYAGLTWDEIKARHPSLIASWPAGFEPLPLPR